MLLLIVVLSPLVGAAANGLFGWSWQKKLSGRLPGILATMMVAISFAAGVALFARLLGCAPEARRISALFYQWIPVGRITIPFELVVDPLSIVMVLVVSGVGSLIHLYSIGYMAHDSSKARYFSYLNLFSFSMLMFIGWEGVGLCSYLLISFWYTDLEKAKAGGKAFLVNRIGDMGFLAGILILFWGLAQGTTAEAPIGVGFDQLRGSIEILSSQTLLGVSLPALVALLFFIGATGKSAQIPLYVWLPDAMAGPTPVSALIHAATMVTAGVYMIARLSFLYLSAPWVLAVVAVVGAGTALFAATIGFAQTDIKKVLAYSTISQLGFMFAALGVGAFSAGVFHLMTHAFFKACLFLCAGSVIHGLSGEQDIRRMGALRKKLPVTHATFLVATLAIAGIPGLSGFFSKDEILWKALSTENAAAPGLSWIVFGALALAALCTAFYMLRLLFLTFYGPTTRLAGPAAEHIHESPASMTVPLAVLAGLAVIGGYIGLSPVFGTRNHFEEFLAPVFGGEGGGAFVAKELGQGAEVLVMAGSVAIALLGIGVAWLFYRGGNVNGAEPIVRRIGPIYRLVAGKYFIDELYQAVVVRPFLWLTRAAGWFDDAAIDRAVNLSARWTRIFSDVDGWIDRVLVDGAVNLVAKVVSRVGKGLRSLQTGRIRDYAYVAAVGLFLVFILLRMTAKR
jgi:NADH-quinone oxidoreductase subunit L